MSIENMLEIVFGLLFVPWWLSFGTLGVLAYVIYEFIKGHK